MNHQCGWSFLNCILLARNSDWPKKSMMRSVPLLFTRCRISAIGYRTSTAVAAFRSLNCTARASSTVAGPKPGDTFAGVVVEQEPEFEGEMLGGNSSSTATIPTPRPFDISALTMGIQRRSRASDAGKVDHVFEAYMNFFEHVRFRNGWATPPFTRDDVSPIFREAADVTVRIRNFLDVKNPATKLRKADGEAQAFLHSEQALALFKNGENRKMIAAIVHATFRDAIGYVEGLNRATVDSYLAEIFEYQYNPRCHALHQVEWLRRTLIHDTSLLLDVEKHGQQASSTTDKIERTTSYYCPTEAEENKWRKVVGRLYDAMNEVQHMQDAAESNRQNANDK